MSEASIFRDLGVEPIINASGPVTRLGGSLMPSDVLDAFLRAAGESVPMEALQGAASRILADATGAEAGLVTAGAAAGLTLGTAAILAQWDRGRMESLPRTDHFPNEFVVSRAHRNGYDHAVRAAGATLVDVGLDELGSGAGVRQTEAWEYEAAFGPKTAGVLYVVTEGVQPTLEEVAHVAHSRDLPVLVDAAAVLPPRRHLRDLIKQGADLVSFSGGKAIRGPQSTGILCGRKDLVGSAFVQMLDMDEHAQLWDPPAHLVDRALLSGPPRHGIGRSLKVSKEEIVALLTALRLFTTGAYDEEVAGYRTRLRRIHESLKGLSVSSRLVEPTDAERYPRLEIEIDHDRAGRDAFEICRALRSGFPPVYPGHWKLRSGILVIQLSCVREKDDSALIRRLEEVLR